MDRIWMKIGILRTAVILFFLTFAFGYQTTFAGEEGAEKPKLEEEDKPSASADVGVFSQYIWRGWELSKDSVVIQPSATLGYKEFSMNVWGNWDTHQYGLDKSSWNETDLTLSYERSFGPFTLGGGWVYYALNSFDDQQEFFFIIEGFKMRF